MKVQGKEVTQLHIDGTKFSQVHDIVNKVIEFVWSKDYSFAHYLGSQNQDLVELHTIDGSDVGDNTSTMAYYYAGRMKVMWYFNGLAIIKVLDRYGGFDPSKNYLFWLHITSKNWKVVGG
ncbi:hypothetical protein [Lactobacillus hominis]|uniref:Uncharacterized protein n=1 Tax=Lactobacillus hominis DSM 23910 = CRBIP 24.179 TaxID=1423758 RepID=I7IVN3_9LACO|nr:hypothetical protein [Lactobacillus hominis]KRM85736.1 hypothetical protein FC41_GL001051 [Lactobacillus hominis DSM 23910 = CRBIP 24.179]MCT3347217.1 hypothetical protein [Lactobacillus hominis]CCI81743.1 Protein of unknown function [Lactobacillus hominis DSM 23910 = CRBIP 24.179]